METAIFRAAWGNTALVAVARLGSKGLINLREISDVAI